MARSSQDRIPRRSTLGGLCLCLLAVGCAERPAGQVPVTGAILLEDGSPLQGVQGFVVFYPWDPENPDSEAPFLEGRLSEKTCRGWVSPDGKFELSTVESGDGAKPGHYKVILNVQNIEEAERPIVDQQYTQYAESPWTAHITADRENHIVLRLETSQE
jgi:hypothetical protein